MEEIFTITRIEEADFGCEERPAGYVPVVTVYLSDVAGAVRTLEMEDALLYERELDEGSRAVIGMDGTLFPPGMPMNVPDILSDMPKHAQSVSKEDLQEAWMNNYLDAVEEMEDNIE